MVEINTFGRQTSETLLAMAQRERFSKLSGPTYDVIPASTRTFFNFSGGTIPAYACMKVLTIAVPQGGDIFTFNADQPIHVIQPNGTGGPFIFNSSSEVADGKYGEYQSGTVIRALTKKKTDGTTPGAIWGPVKDEWVVTGFDLNTDTDDEDHDAALVMHGTIYESGNEQIAVGSPIEANMNGFLFAAPVGGIPARSGDTPGGPVIVQPKRFDGSVLATIPSGGTPINFLVYNWVKQAVCTTGDRYGWAQMDRYGRNWVIAADCSDA